MISRPPGRKKSYRVGVPFRAPDRRAGLARWIPRKSRLALALSFVVLSLSLSPYLKSLPGAFREDMDYSALAPDAIQTEIAFDAPDPEATRLARAEAAAKIPDTFRVNRERVGEQLEAFNQFVSAVQGQRKGMDEALRERLLASDSTQPLENLAWETAVARARAFLRGKANWKGLTAEDVGVFLLPDEKSIPERQFEAAPEGAAATEGETPRPTVSLKDTTPAAGRLSFAAADELLELTRDALEYTLQFGIVSPDARGSAAENEKQPDIKIVRDSPGPDQARSEVFPPKDVPKPDSARNILSVRLAQALQGDSSPVSELVAERAKALAGAVAVADAFTMPTLEFDSVGTASEREEAAAQVAPKTMHIRPNTMLIGAGEEWTDEAIARYEAYLAAKRARRPFTEFVARIVLVALVLASLLQALRAVRDRRSDPPQQTNVTLLIMCVTVFAGAVISMSEPTGYVVPAAAGAILLAILVNTRVAMIGSLLTTVLISIAYDYSWGVFLVQSAMCLAGVFSIRVVRRRSDMARASVKATVIGFVAVSAYLLAMGTLFSEDALRMLLLIGLNGLLCLFLVPGLLSPLERVFGITTDIQLLEYSDLNNEILSRMAIEIPATNAHSQRLGQLAEAAADAIGANGLLAQVCAYYHDIGKLKRPEYFAENQTGVNIHDDLSPRLSARAIASHVLEGAEMAREMHLPKPIVDGILEHHGTSLISFFYQEALAQQKHGDVREEDFRYPGPKPQRRETAILMICDAAESGVRTIKNPNEERIREFVDKIVKARADDGQFDECDLTLKDLDTIKEIVTSRLVSFAHERIAYPDQKEEKDTRPPNVVALRGGQES
jgi:putative nucleotidyltransferase with HDIG domain